MGSTSRKLNTTRAFGPKEETGEKTRGNAIRWAPIWKQSLGADQPVEAFGCNTDSILVSMARLWPGPSKAKHLHVSEPSDMEYKKLIMDGGSVHEGIWSCNCANA